MDKIINRVKNSPLISIDIKEYYQEGKRQKINLSSFLDDGILIEKKFRDKLKNYRWSQFKDSFVYVVLEEDLIIPSWAFILISHYLSNNCLNHVFGERKNLEEKLYLEKINSIDLKSFKGKKVIIKGCSEIPYFEYVYFELTKKLSQVVFSLMYGEPCSTVPIFKNKI
jgi:hypothetical protein